MLGGEEKVVIKSLRVEINFDSAKKRKFEYFYNCMIS